MFKQINLTRSKSYFWVLFLIGIPVIIYFYFLKWKTDVVYGDDLYMFRDYFELSGFLDKINLPLGFGKYRPIHGLSFTLLIETVQKNLDGYYLFNIAIQCVNTFVFALVLNLFFKQRVYALLFSLILGLSRFAYFNISQLLNGGALEGLAMTFFLCALYFLLRSVVKGGLTNGQTQRGVILSLLFANLSMYTHERYIVFFPFIVLVVIFFPALRALPLKNRITLGAAALGSIFLNVVIKKYIYSMPFFVGTGGTNIEFSFARAFGFLKEALLSIIQINSGPEYLVGIKFSSLPVFTKVLVLVLVSSILVLFFFYLRKAWQALAAKKDRSALYVFISLWVLLGLFLIPAVVTIRLEHRWLQAPFSLFVLLVVISLSVLKFKNPFNRSSLFTLFVLIFIWIDYNYLYKGADNLYMNDSKRVASGFQIAIKEGIIHPTTRNLYIWVRQRDDNSENAIKWSLGDGYLFDFYGNGNKKLTFVDSINGDSATVAENSLADFNKVTDQIVFRHGRITDITEEYLTDSLKTFLAWRVNLLTRPDKVDYDQENLTITNDDFSKFAVDGFHENENGIRWTNGNASIAFMGDYTIEDSLDVELNTYMPPICQNIKPEVLLVDYYNKGYRPVAYKREGDKFRYKFYFARPTAIQKINIVSDTINAAPDIRVLSFPFKSMALND